MRGSKPGERRGGRKRGTPNKRTKALEEARQNAAAKIERALGDAAFDGDAHALLMSVYKDGGQPIDLRLEAARAAIAFEKPRLSSIHARVKHDDLDGMTDDELRRYLKRGLEELGLAAEAEPRSETSGIIRKLN